jgi:hypothetical protein
MVLGIPYPKIGLSGCMGVDKEGNKITAKISTAISLLPAVVVMNASL